MFLRKANSKWIVRTPAKLNVYLSIRGRRTDGYHEVQTLMVPIRLFDSVVFEPCPLLDTPPSGIGFNLARPSRSAEPLEVPADGTNLVVRAVTALRQRTGCRYGARITLTKRIPAGAGLGGGSSDAAAALVAANEAWGLGLPHSELSEVAASLGSDVPFFLTSSAAVCSGRGEIVAPLESGGRLHVIVVTPKERLASAAVYAALGESDYAGEAATGSDRFAQLVRAFRRGDVGTMGRLLCNGLARAALSLEPGLARLSDVLVRLSGGKAAMTGSGSSFFCLCRTEREARRGAARLRSLRFASAIATASYG